MIKFWAWVYRVTGWYSPWARVAEYSYIISKLNSFFKSYTVSGWSEDASFEDYVGLRIGMWQAHKGFLRKNK